MENGQRLIIGQRQAIRYRLPHRFFLPNNWLDNYYKQQRKATKIICSAEKHPP